MSPSLEITTFIANNSGPPCPNNCSFCPQSTLRDALTRDASSLKVEDFLRLLSGRVIPKDVEIHFSGFTEPFFNRLTPHMILAAKGLDYKVHLYTTLMGLTQEGAKMLPKTIDFVMIHFPDVRAFVVNDALFIRQHQLWLSTGIPSRAMAMGTLTAGMAEYVRGLGWSNGVELPAMNTRAGNVSPMDELKTPRVFCSEDRWHNNVMLPNGDVYLCCMDYGLEYKLGNLFNQPYQEIWDAAEKLKESLISPSLCLRCDKAMPAPSD